MASPHRWTSPVVSVFACALGLAACTASSPQPLPPNATVNVGPSDSSAPAGASGAPSAPAPTATASADVPPQSVITNEPPPNGTVTANASPAPAGSDRMKPMMDLIASKRDGFRKCFDLWGKKNPGQAGKIAFQFFLKVDGSLDKAAMKADEGDVHAPEVENCMIAYAKTLTYPPSTTGKETVYTHRFEFKASSK
jgi:hypothetical protein